MIYTKNEVNKSTVIIENPDEGDSYTAIGSKAFLSCKNVCEIKLPDTIREIGDWAFAHMKELKKIYVPSTRISIGREAFLDCTSLEEIIIDPDETQNKGLSFLLASCVTIFNNYKLLDFELAAKNNTAWSKLYDSELISFINQPDEKDFKFYIVGWFDDDSEEEQLTKYIERIKKEKLKLCFLRLKYDFNCDDLVKNELAGYIKRQFENYDADDLAWTLFCEELSDDLKNVQAAVNNDIINEALISELIEYINKRDGNPEAVAYLLSLLEEKKSLEDLFEL